MEVWKKLDAQALNPMAGDKKEWPPAWQKGHG